MLTYAEYFGGDFMTRGVYWVAKEAFEPPHRATSCFYWAAGVQGVCVYVWVGGAPVAFGTLHRFQGPKEENKKRKHPSSFLLP